MLAHLNAARYVDSRWNAHDRAIEVPPSMIDQFPTRVLLFVHETTWSGAPIQLLHLVAWLKGKGWEVAVAVPKPETAESGPISDELRRVGVKIFPVVDLSASPDLRRFT
jgi:hypothetical protein